MNDKSYYDAVIIGSGVGGLVCGCNLAKAGLKILVVEKNSKPGGYCTSFRRGIFHFNACAHSLGGLRKDGALERVLKNLAVNFEVKRCDPLDVIITPEFKINIWNNLEKTIGEFQFNFPKESIGIRHFFDFIEECRGPSFHSLTQITFKDILDKYFKDPLLKSIISYPLFGNSGLPPSKISAFSAITIFKDFILGGGYYFEKGIQELPNLLTNKFKELGGKILLSTLATKIELEDNCVKGIRLESGEEISANYVISNSDARETFFELVGKKHLEGQLVNKLNHLSPTLSTFTLYLGVDKKLEVLFKPYSNIWYFPHDNLERIYSLAQAGEVERLDWFLLFVSEDKRSIVMSTNVSYKSKDYWKINKIKLTEIFIKKLDSLIPGLSNHVSVIDASTPDTLQRWTLNYRGASFGWESTPSQFAVPGLSQTTPIKNLYLTGHWTTEAQGISGVAYLGNSTAKLILAQKEH